MLFLEHTISKHTDPVNTCNPFVRLLHILETVPHNKNQIHRFPAQAKNQGSWGMPLQSKHKPQTHQKDQH